jgi:hypothetical protein
MKSLKCSEKKKLEFFFIVVFSKKKKLEKLRRFALVVWRKYSDAVSVSQTSSSRPHTLVA